MPYIKSERREEIDCSINSLITKVYNAGDINYAITLLLHYYFENKGMKYKHINEVIGILECAKLELYRQIAVPYEDIKKKENGAVSELDKGNILTTTKGEER